MARSQSKNRVPHPPKQIRIQTLGHFAIETGDGPLGSRDMGKRRPLELLKGLIAFGGRNVQAIQLAESIWPDTDGDQLYGTLTVTINRLRQVIGHDTLELRDGRMHLNEGLCWVDLWALNEALQAMEGALKDAEAAQATEYFENVMDLYRGPFLEGEFHPPEILACRERTHGRMLRVIHNLGERLLAGDEKAAAIRIFQRGLELDELAEELYQQLMRCYLEQGRFAEGITLYERCAQIFRNNIGIDPAEATQALHTELRAEAASREPPPEVAPEPTPQAPAPESAARHAATAQEPDPGNGTRPPQADGAVHGNAVQGAMQGVTEHSGDFGVAQEGELRPATIACIRFEGLNLGLQAAEAHTLHEGWARLKAELLQAMQSEGGEVNQFVGGEALVLFGIPQAHEDDPLRAVAAVLGFRERLAETLAAFAAVSPRPVSLRIGLASGPVAAYPGGPVGGRFELIGEPVALAAALAEDADAGDVVICDQTRRRIEPFYTLEPVRALRVNGGVVAAFRVLERTDIDDRFQYAQRQGFTPYTGREEERGILLERLERVRSGQGQFVTLVGDAGIGKSRFLLRFQEEIPPDGAAVLLGRCRPTGSNPPYRPISDALRNGMHLPGGHDMGRLERELRRKLRLIDPGLEAFVPVYLYLLEGRERAAEPESSTGGEALRNDIAEAVAALMTQSVARRPMVVLLEDWHWADEASDMILKRLINTVAEYPLFLAVTYRPEYAAGWRNLRNHTHIALEPLTQEHTESIVRWMLGATRLPEGLAELVHQRSEGNPYFIEEICQAMRGSGQLKVEGEEATLDAPLDDLAVPDTVQAVVRARMDRIDPQGRSVLRLASVIGMEVPRTLLEAVVPQGRPLDDTLERLQEVELLRMVRAYPDVVFRFNHYITQRVVYETILPSERRLLHARVGQAYETCYQDRLTDKMEALAHHFSESRERAKAVLYLEQAGDKAAHYFSLEEARRYYQDAVNTLNEGEPGEPEIARRIDLALKWGRVSFYHPRQELLRALEASNRDALALKDATRIARTTFWTGMIHYALGRHRQAVEYLSRCLTLRSDGPDHEEIRALTISYLGRVHFYTTQFGPAAKQLGEGIERLSRMGNHAEAVNNMGLLAMVHAFTGRFPEAEAVAERMYALVARENNPTIQGMAHVAHGLALLFKGDWHHADLQLAYIRRNAYRVSNPIMEGLALWGQGYGMALAGERKRGIALMHEGIGIIESVQSHYALTIFYGLLAVVHAEDGNCAMATRLARRSLEIKEIGGGQIGEFAAYCALALCSGTGSPSGWKNTQAFIDEAQQVAADSGNWPGLAMVHYHHARLLAQRGYTGKAEACRREAIAMFEEMDMAYWLDKARRL